MGVGVLIAVLLIVRHGARAAVITGLLLGPVYLLAGLGWTLGQIGLATGVVIILRFRLDWHREYRELWLDREQPE
jgi:hypothetical protein